MWLINTTSCKLEFFTPPRVPEYAILSHTWGEDEVTFQEFQDLEKAKVKKGLTKIKKTCLLARDSEIDYAWVDTCCIDKSSSAELSESINSMYSWYQHAKICYAYIDDWLPGINWADLRPIYEEDESEDSSEQDELEENDSDEDSSEKDSFEDMEIEENESEIAAPSNNGFPAAPLRWFTRGWTLQELIAPRTMEFCDSDWNLRGSKVSDRVIRNLSRITGIEARILRHGSESRLRQVCLGQRMSWAACRETSREEDIAYCLLGIFQINMPLLYGEGGKAFLRLQEEVLKSSTDLSILAWQQHYKDRQEFRGIFSHHPIEFKNLRDCVLEDSQFSLRDEIVMTNKGARVRTLLFTPRIDNHPQLTILDVQFLYLGCFVSGRPQGIMLKNVQDFYVRGEPSGLIEISDKMRRYKARTIYLTRDMDRFSSHEYNTALRYGLKVKLTAATPYNLEVTESWPPGLYDHLYDKFLLRDLRICVGYIIIAIRTNAHYPSLATEVARIMAICRVIDDKGRKFSVQLVKGARVLEFEKHAELLGSMDPVSAERELLKGFKKPFSNWADEIAVRDEVRGSSLRIRGTIVNRKPAEGKEDPDRGPVCVKIGLEIEE